MSSDILISVKRQWVDLILTGKKKVEIRKTKPLAGTPFRCFLYQSGSGLVVWEFVCKYIVRYVRVGGIYQKPVYMRLDRERCLPIDYAPIYLTPEQMEEYGAGANLYGWHVASPKRYETPVPLESFGLARPPQSWRYVRTATW